ncbi:peptidylprolyl isomerase [Candidatus Uhrbacteria bacterium]|nr:peptidylprolyl isomerase [Candidatus Uhrbacteria bacterium]
MQVEKTDPATIDPFPTHSISETKSRRPFFVFISILGLLVILTLLVYRLPITNPFVRSVAFVIPYPAAMVDGSFITMKTYIIEREALTQYLKTTGLEETPSDDELQQMILQALVNKTAIRILANGNNVKIDQKMVDSYYQDVVENEESEDAFAKELSETFGWSKADFKKRIIESIVLALQMSDFVSKNETLQAPARERIEKAYARLKSGEDFVTVANEVHSEDNAPYESDLGYQNVADLPEEWSAAKDLPVGGLSNIIEFDEGYAVFTVTDRIEAAEDSQVQLLAIIVPKKTLEDLVEEYLSQTKVRYFVD